MMGSETCLPRDKLIEEYDASRWFSKVLAIGDASRENISSWKPGRGVIIKSLEEFCASQIRCFKEACLEIED
jgi:hypothetical protein